MPELIEVEAYRRAAMAVVGRRVVEVLAPDAWFVRAAGGPESVVASLTGVRIDAVGRRGKLLLLHTDGPTVGLRFGMTGRLLVDGHGPIDRLEYGPVGHDPRWERLSLRFAGGGELTVVDPRRLGGVELDPDLDRLGPDASTVSTAALRSALSGTRALKAVLLDQSRLAGVGNLLADESLFRAGLSPERAVNELNPAEVRRLAATIRSVIADLSARGGSHTGDLQAYRRPGARCPRCGTALQRSSVGGRTTVWCPGHQR